MVIAQIVASQTYIRLLYVCVCVCATNKHQSGGENHTHAHTHAHGRKYAVSPIWAATAWPSRRAMPYKGDLIPASSLPPMLRWDPWVAWVVGGAWVAEARLQETGSPTLGRESRESKGWDKDRRRERDFMFFFSLLILFIFLAFVYLFTYLSYHLSTFTE